MIIAVIVLIAISLFFALAGVVGMLRMPDTYCRMQSSTNIATLGILGVIIGGILYCFFILHDPGMGVKIIVLGIFYIVTNPIASHALARAAYRHGVRPEKKMETDQLEEDMEND